VSKLAVAPSTVTPPTTNTPSTPGVSKLVVAPPTGTPSATTLSLNSVTPSSVTPVSDLKNSLIGVSKDVVTVPSTTPSTTPSAGTPSTGTPSTTGGQKYVVIPGASPKAQDFLNDSTIQGKFLGIAQYKQDMASKLESAAASLSAQDFSNVDAGTADMQKYLNTAIEFENETKSDTTALNGFVAAANADVPSVTGLVNDIKTAATAQGLNYDKDVAPYIKDSMFGPSYLAAQNGLQSASTTLDANMIDYANRLGDKADQYLQGFDVVKKNENVDFINQLLNGVTSVVNATMWAGPALLKGVGLIAAGSEARAAMQSLNTGDFADMSYLAQTWTNTFWKGSPVNAPNVHDIVNNLSPTDPGYMDKYNQSVNADLTNALGRTYGANGSLQKLATEVQKEWNILHPPPPDDDGGWYIPSV
jgi:hypothetical protein